MNNRYIGAVLGALLLAGCNPSVHEADPAKVAVVGKLIFFDPGLSNPPGQSCSTCHSAERAFTDPDSNLPVSQGVHLDRVGSRNSPSASYASFSPEFHYEAGDGTYAGGQFWDGRASTLEDQAKAPFLNPVEMANGSKEDVVAKLREAPYRDLFREAFGVDSLDDVDTAYDYMAAAIASFERTAELNRFTSKFDYYLRGMVDLNEQELNGLALFENPLKGNCSACHPSVVQDDGTFPLFTDFTYDNIGIPKNWDSPFLDLPIEFNPDGAGFIDRGLGAELDEPEQDGKFKVPTLRNLALTAPYGHNGYFTNLRDVVDFYNTRDVDDWPDPEVPENLNTDELGDLGLTGQEVDDIVAFLQTLTDGFVVPAP